MKPTSKQLMLLVAAAAIFATAACSNKQGAESPANAGQHQPVNSNQEKNTDQQANDNQAAPSDTGAEDNQTEEQQPDLVSGNESLFADLPAYDGTSEIDMTIEGEVVTAKFESLAPYQPFGLYIPSTLERYDREDGVEFGYNDGRDLITIGPISQFAVKEADLEKTKEELTPYTEYIGSQPEGGDNPAIQTDFFAFEHEGNRFGIRFRYAKEEAATAVPRFLATIRTLALIEEAK